MTQQGSMTADEEWSATIASVRCEYRRASFGIGEMRPRLSWIIETGTPEWYQASYEVEVYEADVRLRERTERIESDQSVFVSWPFAPLLSRECLTVRVRVWGVDGQASAWSKPVLVEAGLFSPSDWTARFITPDWE